MRAQRIAAALTVINLLLLTAILLRGGPVIAREEPPILRGRGIEIVDERGRLRAQLLLTPASKTKEGRTTPDGVLFRLIDPNGRPAVKIGGSEEGSGISLAGDSERRDWNGIQILAEGTGSRLKLTNKDGRVQVIKP
jgi:hypothetical protein